MLHKCKIITVITGLGYETTAPGGGRQSPSWWAVGLESGGAWGRLHFFWRPLVRWFRAHGGPSPAPHRPTAGDRNLLLRHRQLLPHLRFFFWRVRSGRKLPALRGAWLRLGTPLLKWRALPGGSSPGFMSARWPHDPLSREAPRVSRVSFLEV